MRLFGKREVTNKKNVLIIGPKGCGKKSFIQYYKEGLFTVDTLSMYSNTITCKEKIPGLDGYTSIDFVLDRSSDALMPSLDKEKTYDLILILLDLSSKNFLTDYKLYEDYAKNNFKDVKKLIVGTKADGQSLENNHENLLITSAKEEYGFEEFRNKFHEAIKTSNSYQFKINYL